MTSNTSKPAPVKAENWMLAKSRQWHLWGGLIAWVFLLIVATTGIVLNYKKPIFTALGLENDAKEMKSGRVKSAKAEMQEEKSVKLTTANGFAAATVGVGKALALARESWGEVPLERIELKDEHGTLLYKLKSRGGEELQVNAITGAHFIKGEYEKVSQSATGEVIARRTDWGKIMLDLHTGKIGGEVGKAIMTVAAGLLLLLTLSGVYMWLKPLLIRRQNARARRAALESGLIVPPLASDASRRQSFASHR